MRNKLIAKRYAQAYIDFASDKIGLERCVSDMKTIKALLRDIKDLSRFFFAPEISRAEKVRILDKIFVDICSDETRTFIKYLIDKRRLEHLPDIADYVRVNYAHGEAQNVVLRTTFPLDLDVITSIKAKIEQRLNKKATLYLELAPELLGGIQILIGNTIIDGSVRNRLNILKKKLLQAQVVR